MKLGDSVYSKHALYLGRRIEEQVHSSLYIRLHTLVGNRLYTRLYLPLIGQLHKDLYAIK